MKALSFLAAIISGTCLLLEMRSEEPSMFWMVLFAGLTVINLINIFSGG
jgi:hypothetical protein